MSTTSPTTRVCRLTDRRRPTGFAHRLPCPTTAALPALRIGVAVMSVGAVLLWPASTVAAKSSTIATVRAIVHRLTLLHPHTSAAAARVRQPLFSADGLRTAVNDKASITFADKAILHINQRTDLILRSPKLTTLTRGEIDVVDAPGSVHRIQTAGAIASALGTRFDVRIERAQSNPYSPTPTAKTFPPGTTTVSVVKGAVRVSNARGAVTVQAGQWTHVPPGQAPTVPTRHNAKGDVAWTAGLGP